ncbi:MAG: 50S ribosomal protein L1 [Candidatus Omnitrophota bacterium]|nr:MAG: 50S ribosomal protein L1 [Candidatus Omnitrophota bacterium]
MSHSKRYLEAEKLIERSKTYPLEEAIATLKNMPHSKFDETLEVSCTLGLDSGKSDQMVRGSVILPKGSGKKIKVLAFCEPEKEEQARGAGADYIGSQEIIDKISNQGWLDFDYCVSTPTMMKLVSRLGKILGPRGLMPSPKTGTVTENISYAVQDAKRGKINFRMDKFGCIHAGVGKISFTNEALIENVRAFMGALMAARPQSAKGDFIKACYLSTTMSPSLKVNI